MDLAHELHDLVLTLDRSAEAMLRPEGLTYRRYVALVVIGEHPGLAGRDLAGGLGVTEAATSGIVKRLLTDGLVHDVAPTGSGHVRRLELTDAGRKLLDRCTALLGDSFEVAVRDAGFDADELARTIRTIHDRVRSSGETS